MSVNGTAGLFFVPPKTTMNSQIYVDLLKDKLELHMAIHKCKIFMQGGAPYYRKVSEKQPINTRELEEAIEVVWVLELSAEYCRSLMESISKRLEAVIKAKGGPTKY